MLLDMADMLYAAIRTHSQLTAFANERDHEIDDSAAISPVRNTFPVACGRRT